MHIVGDHKIVHPLNKPYLWFLLILFFKHEVNFEDIIQMKA